MWYIIIWKARHSSCWCCVSNPLRPKGRVIYWALTLWLSQHLLTEDLSAYPYSLMIITDHLPKWLINKAEAKQIIYLYGFVDIKFRVNGLKRIRVLGHQVMDGPTGAPWKYGPFNKFAKSCLPPPPSAFVTFHSCSFHKVRFFPKICLLTECKPSHAASLSLSKSDEAKHYKRQTYEWRYFNRSFLASV